MEDETGVSASAAGAGGLSVYPPQVEFHAVQPGVLYVMTISIQNTDTHARRIRFIPPASTVFEVKHLPLPAIAPGLDVRAEVEFIARVRETAFDGERGSKGERCRLT
jgi:hypothetical protein